MSAVSEWASFPEWSKGPEFLLAPFERQGAPVETVEPASPVEAASVCRDGKSQEARRVAGVFRAMVRGRQVEW